MTAEDFWDDVFNHSVAPVLLADIGTFFNQDTELAKEMIHTVKASGAKYVKGEVLHNADICLPTSITERYLANNNQIIDESYRSLIERKTLSLSQYNEIFSHSRNLSLGLVLSVYDNEGADFAKKQDACALKIASSNIVHAPLIRHCASLDLPLILDTGKSDITESLRAVQWAQQAGATRIILEYSPPAPPHPVSQHNLRVFEKLASIFDGPLGLSDHHSGEEMLFAATALGCRVLEKGLCPDDSADDQDVSHALPLSRLKETLRQCRTIHTALGNAEDAYPPCTGRSTARMGIVAARNIEKGEMLDENSVRFAFPTLGIPVEDWDKIKNTPLTMSLLAGQPIEWQHVIPSTS